MGNDGAEGGIAWDDIQAIQLFLKLVSYVDVTQRL